MKPTKLIPEIKAAWLVALRSGEYKQGRGRLRQEENGQDLLYCCLGVLLDVLVKQFPEKLKDYTAGELERKFKYGGMLSIPLIDRIGPIHDIHLVGMNDMSQFSFDEIADWIEANL